MAWSYPNTISSGNAFDATVLQKNLDYARRRVNNITDNEVTGFDESAGGGFVPSGATGHDHDGTNSRLGAVAVQGSQGALKADLITQDVATSAWSTDFLSGSNVTTPFYIFVGYKHISVGLTDVTSEGPDAENCFCTRNMSGNCDVFGLDDFDFYYTVWDETNGELFVYNDINSTSLGGADGVDVTFYVLVVGT